MSTAKLRHLLPLAVLAVPLLASCGSVLESKAEARRCDLQATALSPEEERVAATGELASRFNPAMAFPGRDIWPVDVSYAWHDGSDVVARVRRGSKMVERAVVPSAEIARRPWGELPATEPDGRPVLYGIDAPGDDELVDGVSRWIHRWRAINGENVPDERLRAAPYPPTQYAHLYWVDREAGLLGIQYFFYYPFNEWLNHHEGDWEHINVVLQGPSRLTPGAQFRVRRYEFFFHDWSMIPDQVMMSAEPDHSGEHVVVFVGGHGSMLAWSGEYSGGSYPMPASYRHAGGGPHLFRAADDTSKPHRFIPAADFRLIVLPEPSRLDDVAHPELSWLKLDFRIGQSRVRHNPPLVEMRGGGAPPRQPAQSGAWNGCRLPPAWAHDEPRPDRDAVQSSWAARMRVAPVRSALTLQQSSAPSRPGS